MRFLLLKQRIIAERFLATTIIKNGRRRMISRLGVVDIIAKIVVDNEGEYESTTAKYTVTIEEGYQTLKWNETTKQMESVVLDATVMPAESELADKSSDKLLPAGTKNGEIKFLETKTNKEMRSIKFTNVKYGNDWA